MGTISSADRKEYIALKASGTQWMHKSESHGLSVMMRHRLARMISRSEVRSWAVCQFFTTNT